MKEPARVLLIQAPEKPRTETQRRLRDWFLRDEFQTLRQNRPIVGIKPTIRADLQVLAVNRGKAGLTLLFEEFLNPPTMHHFLHFSGSASNPQASACERDEAALSLC